MASRGKGDAVRRYGWFKCSSCGRGWESGHAWVKRGTDIPVYGQECQSCPGTFVKPYKVEKLMCPLCGQRGGCFCDRDEKHVDRNKPHRSDLCERCKSGKHCKFAM